MMAYHGQQDKKNGGSGKSLFRLLVLLTGVILAVFLVRFFVNRQPLEDGAEPPVGVDRTVPVEAGRGDILDRFGNPLAVSLVDSSIYVKPREFADITETTKKLAKGLGLNAENLLTELKTQKSFIWLARHIPYRKAREIEDLDLSGVYVFNKVKRVYPHNFKVPGIIGEVSQEEGLSGLEYYYNDLLMGSDTAEGSPRDLYLTLDLKTQVLLEQKLSVLLDIVKHEEAGGKEPTILKAMVMNCKTGGIVACAQQASGTAGSVSSISLAEQSSSFFSDYIDPGGFEELFRQAATLRVNRSKSADNATEVKVIRPAGMKKEINPPPGPAWRRSEEGDLLYPWFARVINKKELTGDLSEGKLALSDLELAAFSAGLGFSSPLELDLPRKEFLEPDSPSRGTFLVDEDVQVLPLNLLSGFSCVMTGRSHQPHFLKTVVSEGGEKNEYKIRDISGGICEGISKDLLVGMRKAVDSDSIFVLESLRLREEYRDDYNQRQCVDGVALAFTRTGRITGSETGLVMLLTMEKGSIDLFRESPVKPVIKDFLAKALLNVKQQKMLKPEQIRQIGEEYLEGWLLTESEKAADRRDSYSEGGGVMPDLLGMSIRRALRALQNRRLHILIHGSGIVVKQYPIAGGRVEGDSCILTAEFQQPTPQPNDHADGGQ